MNLLATIVQASGDYARARTLFADSLAIRRTVFGDDSAQAASAEFNLGMLLLLRLKQTREAQVHLARAVEIGAKTLAPNHGNLANYRLGLGSALRETGRLAEAEAMLQLALPAFETIAAPRGIDIATTRGELACIALARGRSGAREQIDAALATIVRVSPDNQQAQRLRDCR
ncbi:MAG TPA: tetratricopeptide repeat-containing protein [Tahibacter sp.]|nr:tetratricopeptide repeat-containing protein [Tahibacter sp.]